jgi:hypothetical protein
VSRAGSTISAAGGLFALTGGGGAGVGGREDRLVAALRAAGDADDVLHAIVRAVVPEAATLDAELHRAAMDEAFCDVLAENPEADLLNLPAEERLELTANFVAISEYERFVRDVGEQVINNAPADTAARRLREVKQLFKMMMREAFSERATRAGSGPSSWTVETVQAIAAAAVADVYDIFESWIA